jgi:CheY-like chemotaxis protein
MHDMNTKVLILIVDDNEGERFLIRRSLVKLGIDEKLIKTAKDGEEGLELITEYDPEVVLLDLNMPKVTGLELLHLIRRDKKYPPPYIVMLTTSQREEDLGRAVLEGADGFSIKPNEPSKMKEILSAIKIFFIDKKNISDELKSFFQFLKTY